MSGPDPLRPARPVPANLRPYVDVLGVDGAIAFLLTFGGAELYIPDEPKGRGALERLNGGARVRELARRKAELQPRVPLGNRWIAQVLRGRGQSVAQIARTLHITDRTVRNYLRPLP